jgi:endonuclease/exonuclease/phosphatase family metal-dependent hydrolase
LRKHVNTALKTIILIAIVIVVYFIGILLVNTVTNYQPSSESILVKHAGDTNKLADSKIFSMVSWNIGYGGLGVESDFFYDGGNMVKPSRQVYNQYYKGILNKISFFDSLDFVLLQEVDTGSSRSYYSNQYSDIANKLSNFSGMFVKNYDVLYVPLPLFNPMGRVLSGLSTFSSHTNTSAQIVVFPFNYAWPKYLFFPDRCFICLTYQLSSGKKLHIINIHNSAFDGGGSLRNAQLSLLFDYMKTLYKHGDYVVSGGDWNVNPPGFKNIGFLSGDLLFETAFSTSVFEENMSWTVNFDQRYPTNRDVSAVYERGHTPTTIIDYYICSPNIKVLETRGLYNGFQLSDHQAVYLRFQLE